MMTRRAAIYARVSTADQTTDNQLLRLREVAARAGWEIVQTFTETVSGASRSRPALDAMMADAARRRFDVVMAWDVSRLGRSLRDLVDLFESLRALKVDPHPARHPVPPWASGSDPETERPGGGCSSPPDRQRLWAAIAGTGDTLPG